MCALAHNNYSNECKTPWLMLRPVDVGMGMACFLHLEHLGLRHRRRFAASSQATAKFST